MKIFITGINGFIGQHLATVLATRGHEITGIGRDKKSLVQIKKYFSGSVLDKKLVEKASENADVIVHLAALTSHQQIVDDRFGTLETNFLGTKNVLDAFSHSKTAKKFLYSSTGKVYGKISKLPIEENHPTDPLNILGKAKFITEKLIDFYNDNKKEFIILRIFNIYGKDQKENFLIPTIARQLTKKQIILGDIKAKRDYVYIDDLIDAFVKVIERKPRSGMFLYNICSGIGVSAAEIVKIISKITGKEIIIKVNKSLIRHDEMNKEYGSYTLAKKELGWSPVTTLRVGLERIFSK